MVPILAKQAVNIKCNAQSGILVSNYECAYAMGIFAQLSGAEIPEDNIPVSEGLEKLLEASGAYRAADARDEHLLAMLRAYRPDETMDGQVVQLLHMGYEEERLWER